MSGARVVVADSGPIIHLSMVRRVDLLPELFSRIVVPRPVWVEVVEDGAGLPGSSELATADWAQVVEAPDGSAITALLVGELDAGEIAAIAVAKAMDAERLLVDDRAARRAAVRLGLPVIGTLGILLAGRRLHLVDRLAPVLAELRAEGFWMSAALALEGPWF